MRRPAVNHQNLSWMNLPPTPYSALARPFRRFPSTRPRRIRSSFRLSPCQSLLLYVPLNDPDNVLPPCRGTMFCRTPGADVSAPGVARLEHHLFIRLRVGV